MKMNQKNILHNEFLIEVVDINTNKIRSEYKAYNIILDTLFNRIVNFNSFFTSIQFGTGTGELNKARTNLFNFLGSKSASLVESSVRVDKNDVKAKRMIQIMPEEHVGVTITEIGVGYGNNASNLCTHAFILDSQGNPVGIEKKATDVINIYATVYMTFETSHPNITIAGSHSSTTLNPIVEYFIKQSGTIYTQWFLGEGKLKTNSGGLSIGKSFANISNSSTWQKNLDRRETSSTHRFDVNSGNGNIYEIGAANFLRAKLPIPGLWEGYHFKNRLLGVGDGVSKEFEINSVVDPRANSIVVKTNDIVINDGYREEFYFDGTPVASASGRGAASSVRSLVKLKDRTAFLLSSAGGVWVKLGTDTEEPISIFSDSKMGYIYNSDTTSDGRFIATTGMDGSNKLLYGLYEATDLESLTYKEISSQVGFGIPQSGGIMKNSASGEGVRFSNDNKYLLLACCEDVGGVMKYGQAYKYNEELATYIKCDINFNGFAPINTPFLSIATTNDNKYFVVTTADRTYGNNLIVFEIQENGLSAVDKSILFDLVPDIDSAIYALKRSDDGTCLALTSTKDKFIYFYKLVDGKYRLETKYSLEFQSMNNQYIVDNGMDFSPDNNIFCFTYSSSELYMLTKMKDGSFTREPLKPVSNGYYNSISGLSFNKTGKVLFVGQYYYASNSHNSLWAAYSLKENKAKIVFDKAPTEGDVLTFDCYVDYIPKDTNHVLDLELTIQFSDANEKV